ncbi:MAG: SDR family oxidoreductase [Albidovulum sp.]|nr:SDR family oxidoreductase [Albidovulum sp.]MDE0530796.1 SDR family oxidoreductase [Albidovulum sp.]
MLLDCKRILVTGSARGIGYAVAEKCLFEGARVLIADCDAAALSGAAARLGNRDRRLRAAEMDVTDSSSIESAMNSIGDWDGLDGLVNNAAILDCNHASKVTEDRWTQVLDVNLTGALRVTQCALPLLRRSPSPSIVNTLSTQAFFGVPNSAAYATAKGGLLSLTRAMAVDFGGEGLRVNAVAPGFIDTRMALTEDGAHEHELEDFRTHYIEAGRIPLRRPGKPEDCAGAFVFLLSCLSRYITGQTINVDGGLSATY